jgi:hypothetical protein
MTQSDCSAALYRDRLSTASAGYYGQGTREVQGESLAG